MDCSLSGSSVHGILQATILEWITIPFYRRSSWPRDWTQVFCIAGRFFTVWATRKAQSVKFYRLRKGFFSLVKSIFQEPTENTINGESTESIISSVVLEKTLESPLDYEMKPINPKRNEPEYSLEGLLLKLKLQYFGHLIWRTNSLKKTLMLGRIEGKRRRGRKRLRWLDSITDSMDMNLSKLWSQWRTEEPGVL